MNNNNKILKESDLKESFENNKIKIINSQVLDFIYNNKIIITYISKLIMETKSKFKHKLNEIKLDYINYPPPNVLDEFTVQKSNTSSHSQEYLFFEVDASCSKQALHDFKIYLENWMYLNLPSEATEYICIV